MEAFYSGRVSKLERLLLAVLRSKPSTNVQARQLAAGELNEFAAWRVKARADDPLLLCTIDGRTRSWLMLSAAQAPGGTHLYFGSAVVPVRNASTGKSAIDIAFKTVLGFHKRYSQAQLSAAGCRLT